MLVQDSTVAEIITLSSTCQHFLLLLLLRGTVVKMGDCHWLLLCHGRERAFICPSPLPQEVNAVLEIPAGYKHAI
jgi:hypothetical protein